MDLAIANDEIGLVVTTTGGSVWRFFARIGGAEVPIFREPPAGAERPVLQAGCFPMVPFCNRVRGNRFAFDGRDHDLAPNMRWDQHYMHGDGWTSEWSVAEGTDATIRLRLAHRHGTTPYVYDAEQVFRIDGPALNISLSVVNRGDIPLPFGLGLHPYFPLTPGTTLTAATRCYWDQDAQWLPTVRHPTAGDLDFGAGAPLPRRWVNTAFEGWDGHAQIAWRDRGIGLSIDADPLFDRCLVFVSDPAYDPAYSYESFCFEPMSHSVDGHHHADGGGLRRLAPGEGLAGGVRFTVRHAPARTG